jgi:hypothetical protein
MLKKKINDYAWDSIASSESGAETTNSFRHVNSFFFDLGHGRALSLPIFAYEQITLRSHGTGLLGRIGGSVIRRCRGNGRPGRTGGAVGIGPRAG